MSQNHPQVDPDRVTRRIGQKAVDALKDKTVAIIGLGSLGSQTAVLLANSMVGNFTLIDPDKLESHNIVRHACDLRDVDRLKVDAVADLIRFRNPKASVDAIPDRAGNAQDALSLADIVIVAGLGSEIAQQQLGQMLRKMGLPVLFGGLYDKGIAGEILFVSPNDGPCYSCFSSTLRDVTDSSTSQKVNYGLPIDEVKAEPGLGIHVTRVAAVLADWAIRFLINDPVVLAPFEGNMVILSNEEYEIGTNTRGEPVIIPPSSSWWNTLEKLPNCLVCGLKDELHSTETLSDLIE